MRKWVLGQENVIEKPLTIIDIQEANEVFTSNAIDGITQVTAIKKTKQYGTIIAKRLQEKLISLSLGF
jgi:branched-subunit amino acid aminotransferase/4-amino-4-deoxychorismate lyase